MKLIKPKEIKFEKEIYNGIICYSQKPSFLRITKSIAFYIYIITFILRKFYISHMIFFSSAKYNNMTLNKYHFLFILKTSCRLYRKVVIYSFFFVFFYFLFLSNLFAANSTSCYILIEGKSGCSGLTSISDVKYTSQLKCFTIDKNAKDCGIFISVLPTDTKKGLINNLESLDCTGNNKNTQECVGYCFNNSTAPKCTDCNSLTETEKLSYSYCQDEETAKYCEAISNDGNGSSWSRSLAGTDNITGTCLVGYTGTATRDCSSDGTWNDISTFCIPNIISECQNSELNNSQLVILNSGFSFSSTTVNNGCISGFTLHENGQVTLTSIKCNNGTWQYEYDHFCPGFSEGLPAV